MRTDPHHDPADSARRRLEEFARRSSPSDAVPPGLHDPPESDPHPLPGRHAVTAAVPYRSALGSALHGRHLGLIVLAAVLFVLVAIWWTARGAAEPMPVADTTPAAAPLAASTPTTGMEPSAPSSSGSPSLTASATPSPAVVVVDVAGKVRRPAVVTLPSGSRVIDAIRRAGGARAGVDLSALNLARLLVDGEQILVGRPASRGVGDPGGYPGGNPGGTPGGSPGAAGTSGARTNLNTATVAQLEELPGVGPVTAQKIVDWRTENGAFTSAEDLLEVDGIGPKTLESIAPEVTW